MSPSVAKESAEDRKKRVAKIVRKLHKLYPDADCALEHADPWQLLVSTILSAQSTDETVNRVTPALFKKYPRPADLAKADPADVEELIHATGFFRQKTKSIIGAAVAVTMQHGGEVPADMEALIALPGVARKTANVVLGTAFGKNEGVVVDTHIGRLSDRLGLAWSHRDAKDAVKIEKDLMEILPQKEWTFVGHALIWHGRRVCGARKPLCAECDLAGDCPSAGQVDTSSGRAASKGPATIKKAAKKTSKRSVSASRAAGAKKTASRGRKAGPGESGIEAEKR